MSGERADCPSEWKRRGAFRILGLLLTAVLLFAGWTWIALTWSYAKGERAGYVQKLSKKGWLCKTWEGELAMANLPGTMPQIFQFSIRDDSVAQQLTDTMGERVSISYEQHRGIPTTCFGETDYFVTKVMRASEDSSPADKTGVPSTSGTTSPAANPTK